MPRRAHRTVQAEGHALRRPHHSPRTGCGPRRAVGLLSASRALLALGGSASAAGSVLIAALAAATIVGSAYLRRCTAVPARSPSRSRESASPWRSSRLRARSRSTPRSGCRCSSRPSRSRPLAWRALVRARRDEGDMPAGCSSRARRHPPRDAVRPGLGGCHRRRDPLARRRARTRSRSAYASTKRSRRSDGLVDAFARA